MLPKQLQVVYSGL